MNLKNDQLELGFSIVLLLWLYCYNFYYTDFDGKLIDLSGFQMGPTFS